MGVGLADSQLGEHHYEVVDPDVRLMLQVKAGSASAFEELVTRYQNRLLTVLEHMTGNVQMAEDLAQEVFLRVYRSRQNYVPLSKFSTWLFTIANNAALNSARTLNRRNEVHVAPPENQSQEFNAMENLAVAASSQMPTRQLDKSEMREIVRQAVATLNERQRMAVLLSKFEEMSYADVAVVMGMTEKGVKSLLARARVNLRSAITPYMQCGDLPDTHNHEGKHHE